MSLVKAKRSQISGSKQYVSPGPALVGAGPNAKFRRRAHLSSSFMT